MLPTAAAACAARGEGGSPCGTKRSHLPLRTSKMCTSLVAPASLMPVYGHNTKRQLPAVNTRSPSMPSTHRALRAPQLDALTALLGPAAAPHLCQREDLVTLEARHQCAACPPTRLHPLRVR